MVLLLHGEGHSVLPATLYQREPLPWEAGFLAGKSFFQYRRRGGLRDSLSPISILARMPRLGAWRF